MPPWMPSSLGHEEAICAVCLDLGLARRDFRVAGEFFGTSVHRALSQLLDLQRLLTRLSVQINRLGTWRNLVANDFSSCYDLTSVRAGTIVRAGARAL